MSAYGSGVPEGCECPWNGPAACPLHRCPTCAGQGCEEGCGHCTITPSTAGPDAHRQCRACQGTGAAVCSCHNGQVSATPGRPEDGYDPCPECRPAIR